MDTDFTANRTAALKLLAAESVLVLIIALMLLAFATVISAYSALLGGLAFVIPNAWFVRRAFFRGNEDDVSPRTVLNRFYLGEAGKLILTAIIFALCFLMIEPLHIGALFLTYVAMLVVNLAGLAAMGNSPGKQ